MKLLKLLKRRSQNRAVKDYWKFKEIPFTNWQQCQEGNLLATRKDWSENDHLVESDVLHWYSLQDEYIKLFQVDNFMYRKILMLKIKVANLQLTYMRDPLNNRIMINDINQLNDEIAVLQNELTENSITLDELRIIASKQQGYHIPDDITAYLFFTILETLKKHG